MPKILRDYEDKLNYSRALNVSFSQDMRDLAAKYTSGQIDLLEWHIDMREMLRREHALQLITAAGGDASLVDPNDWLKLGSELQKQYRYLEDFANEIKAGNLSDEMIAYRATLYAESSKVSFWKQLTKGVTLPAMPGDGSTECRSNCGCAWENRDGLYYWTLGTADNCETCLQRAAEWNPYNTGEIE